MNMITIDRSIVQQALEAMLNFPDDISDEMFAAIASLKAALAQEQAEPVACPCGNRRVDQCPGEWESGCDLGSNAKYARRAIKESQTLDEAMQQPRAMAQAYENGYKAGQAHERERIIQFLREMRRVVGDAHNHYGVAAVRIKEGI